MKVKPIFLFAGRQFLLALVLFFCYDRSYAQSTINESLKAELDSIFKEDQQYRDLLSVAFTPTGKDSLSVIYKIPAAEVPQFVLKTMSLADSLNMIRIAAIIDQYGYPGKKLVGTPTNTAAFFVIQHSTKIDQYLGLIKKAAKKDDLPFSLYAMMLDRSLMYNGKEQVYGTQGRGFETTNPATGKKEWRTVIWPIKNPSTVNKRRKKAGFPNTAEDNALRLGVKYELFTLEEIRKMEAND